MALFDWNGNGKKDIFDTAIEYEIYKNVFGDDDEEKMQMTQILILMINH